MSEEERLALDELAPEEVAAMLNEIDEQDGVRVARILRIAWTKENDEDFLWSLNGCHGCGMPGDELMPSAEGFVWAKPVNNDKDCSFLAMETYCSFECVEAAVKAWVDEVKCDVYAAYHTL